MSHPVTETTAADAAESSSKEAPKLVKLWGSIRLEAQSLRIVNGSEYLLTLNLINQSTNKTFWLILSGNPWILGTPLNSTVFDPEGFEFHAGSHDIAGIGVGNYLRGEILSLGDKP